MKIRSSNFYQKFRDYKIPRRMTRFIVFGEGFGNVLKMWMEPVPFMRAINRGPEILRGHPSAIAVNISSKDANCVTEWLKDSRGKMRLV